jgi:alkylation response protein AidB-like acyl-CoA dehydrogenase
MTTAEARAVVTSEQLEIRALARSFAEREIRPHTAEWDARRALPDDLFRQIAELGFLGMRIPEEHGGLGLDMATYLLALEALAWGDASAALGVAIHNGPVTRTVLELGSPEQKGRWLPAMAAGDALAAFALSEPGAGSDPSALGCRATREGSGWRLSGRKRWVTNGERAARRGRTGLAWLPQVESVRAPRRYTGAPSR